MRLDEETRQSLKELLHETTALVYVNDRAVATAFFISDDLLLTCAHVPRGDVKIAPGSRKPRKAEIVHRDYAADLILLHSPAEDDDAFPCVVLGRDTPDGADCIVAGYPEGSSGLKFEVVDIPARWRGDHESLVLEPRQIVTWGMSGGPVVSTATGAVVGVVQTSKNAKDALGGEAIPIRRAEMFSEVKDALNGETPSMTRWRNALGRENWRHLDRPWDIGRQIDLRVTGGLTHWTVSIKHAGEEVSSQDPDLGERVTEAIFHWAQRRHTRHVSEVGLLGQLLQRALFPVEKPSWLMALDCADSVVVRLHMTPGADDLADIPWELTADPFSGDPERFLATNDKFVFTRVMDCGAASLAPPESKLAGDIRILTVVAQPRRGRAARAGAAAARSAWEHEDIPGTVVGGYHGWPDVTTMRGTLEKDILNGGFRNVTTLEPATSDGLYNALETRGPYEVLHYMGTGSLQDNKARIAFMNADESEAWADAHGILATAARTGVRLVVLELMLPPKKREIQQLTCHALDKVIKGTVPAVVLTNLPVYPDQCETFNRVFYKYLGRGKSVETAVQRARWMLQDSAPAGDAAGFGWFTFVTGQRAETRLVTPPSLPDPAQSSAHAIAPQPIAGPSDVLHS